MNETQEKWDRIYTARGHDTPVPSRVLEENAHLLPAGGRALELACGRGGNALFLAQQGFETEAWDISPVAIEALDALARHLGLPLRTEARDILAAPPDPGSFDVIVVSHFLDRGLIPKLSASLRPGGLVFYQTFTRTRVTSAGPSNDEFRLADNELLQLFEGFQILVYREEGLQGNPRQGFRDEAMLVALRPTTA